MSKSPIPLYHLIWPFFIAGVVGCAGYRPWWYSDRTSSQASIEEWDISIGIVCPEVRGRTIKGELMLGCQFALYASRRDQAGPERFEIDSIWAYDPNSADEGIGPYWRGAFRRLAHRAPWQTAICIPGEYRLTRDPPLCSHQCVDSCDFELQEGDKVFARVFTRLVERGRNLPDSSIVLEGLVRAPASRKYYFYGPPPTSSLEP